MTLPDRPAQKPVVPFADTSGRRHAYDPDTNPELFNGVMSRRGAAFIIDFAIILAPMVMLSVAFTILGVLTLGLGFALFWLVGPLTVGWALLYVATSLGGPKSATYGMQRVGIELRTWYGAPLYPLLACVHLIVFFITVTTLSPLVLAVALFNGRNRLLHDFICGTVAIVTDPRPMSMEIKRGPPSEW